MSRNRNSIIAKLAIALAIFVSACGGGASTTTTAAVPAAPIVVPPVVVPPVVPPSVPSAIAAPAITSMMVTSTAAATQPSVPITFGQPFKVGDVPAGATLEARDANGNSVPLQMDEASSYPDGSTRFAVLSAQVAGLLPAEQRVISLYKASTANTAATTSVNTAAFDLTLTATVYSPQVSRITFGNRSGTTAGLPYNAGEVITLQLGDAPVEPFSLTVTADQAGGGFPTLTKIAEAFMLLVNTKSATYRAFKVGEGGGYENLWITPVVTTGRAFSVKFVYAGLAQQTITQQQTYSAPRTYQANPRPVLDAQIAANQSPRLNGTVAREYTLVTPFIEVGSGAKHPQLTARLHVRFFNADLRVRTDMVIENNWTYEPNPGNITYDLTATQGGLTILRQEPFTHNHHARWHKVLWSGPEPQVQLRHNMRYFLDSRATWNYDLSLAVPEAVLAAEAANLAKADTKPMGAAFITPYFPTTGGRQDIGPLPRWTALYLVTQDARARASMLANADAAAGIPIHYRDAPTDQPVSLEAHPGLSMELGASNAVDALPVASYNTTTWIPDVSHQASFAYIPYTVTGDAFYLDEIMFWANWNMGRVNPDYRQGGKCLINSEQVRGQAWALRSLGEASHSLPNNHSMKSYFAERLATNLSWYVATYPPRNPNDAELSPLGLVERGIQALQNSRPWMNDFMAIVLGQLADTGVPLAKTYLAWVSKFTVGRYASDALGFCIQKAPAYTLVLLDSTGKQFTDLGQVFHATWPTITTCTPALAVDGSASYADGYAAVSRAMLSVSASLGIADALSAHAKWIALTPTLRDAFQSDPTWAIVPRTLPSQ